MSRAPTNPFYAKSGGSAGASDAPRTYSSLSDLNAGKTSAQTGSSRARYVPPSMRAEGQAGYVATGTKGSAAAVAEARRVPPVPDSGMMPRVPDAPPRRTPGEAARPAGPTAGAGDGYMARAAAYIPESARSGASSAAATAGAGLASAGGYLREGVNNVVTPERADQVKSGVAKVGVGAAKLMGKGAWQLGKLASRST